MATNALVAFSNDLADVVRRAAPSVVQVQNRRRPLSGLVFADGLVVTTARVLGHEDAIRVKTDDGAVHETDVAGWDPSTNLVVLRMNDLAAPPLVASDVAPRVGELAIAIARSWSGAVTVTSGLVSIVGGPLPIGHGHAIERVIRTDASMHGGFSGGAFVGADGRLLGVTTAAEIRGLHVVIPADIAWKSAQAVAAHGTPKRGYLGVAGQPVELPERVRAAGDRTHAILVVGVSAGSPAESAGLLVGDLLVAFDGQPVSSPVELLALLGGDRVGGTVLARIVRGGAPMEIPVTVGERPSR